MIPRWFVAFWLQFDYNIISLIFISNTHSEKPQKMTSSATQTTVNMSSEQWYSGYLVTVYISSQISVIPLNLVFSITLYECMTLQINSHGLRKIWGQLKVAFTANANITCLVIVPLGNFNVSAHEQRSSWCHWHILSCLEDSIVHSSFFQCGSFFQWMEAS